MVESRGKRNKIVPTLLTKPMVEACTLLMEHRRSVGVKETNDFLFPSMGDGPLSSYQTLRKLAETAKCEKPELVTSSRLRKYISTVCQVKCQFCRLCPFVLQLCYQIYTSGNFFLQVMDLTPTEVEWLANHLSHEVTTHKNFYRQHDTTIELVKMTKLLLLAENGDISSLRGKSLQDVSLPPGNCYIISSLFCLSCLRNMDLWRKWKINAQVYQKLCQKLSKLLQDISMK